MLEAPCKTCEYKGCGIFHSKCEAYQAFKKANADLKDKMYESRKKDAIYNSYRAMLHRGKSSLRSLENSPVKCHKK